jgi:hypothetical protein
MFSWHSPSWTGCNNFIFLYLSNRHPILPADGQTHNAINFFASRTATYCYYLVFLQSCVFGIKYLEIAMPCALTPPCIPPHIVKYINLADILIYFIVMLALLIWSMVIFPGYTYNDSFVYSGDEFSGKK